MHTAHWFRRIAGAGAAVSLGGMMFLSGCNHDSDCDSCDTRPGPVIRHERVSDSSDNRLEVEPAQATAYERDRDERVTATGPSAPALDTDIYFRQHQLDNTFDRDAYFRDRAAYVRTHEGNEWWNDHHAELEASWGDHRHFDRDANEEQRRTGFDREMYSVQHPPTERSLRTNTDTNTTIDNKEREPVNTSVQERSERSEKEIEPAAARENKLDNRGTTSTPNTSAGTPKADATSSKQDLDNGRDKTGTTGTVGTPSNNTDMKTKEATPENGREDKKWDAR